MHVFRKPPGRAAHACRFPHSQRRSHVSCPHQPIPLTSCRIPSTTHRHTQNAKRIHMRHPIHHIRFLNTHFPLHARESVAMEVLPTHEILVRAPLSIAGKRMLGSGCGGMFRASVCYFPVRGAMSHFGWPVPNHILGSQ